MLSLGKLALHHLAIKVIDLEACEKFYSQVLGLKPSKFPYDENGPTRSVWLQSEEVILMLEQVGKGSKPTSKSSASVKPGLHLIAFAIGRFERNQWKERLTMNGVSIEAESDFTIYFRDPEGNRVALSHYPDPISEAA